MSSRPHATIAVLTAALAAAGLSVPLTSAHAVSPNVVISEVYGGGGNNNAQYSHDFIELHNAGTTPVDLAGWSVQYASSGGSTWTNRTELTGVVQPGQHYLVQQAAGANPAPALPAPNATGSIAMSATNGKVALVRSTTALTCGSDCDRAAGVHDFVGYGNANDFEGAPAGVLSNTSSAQRVGVDSDNNASDFTVAAPAPQSNASEPSPPQAITGLAIHDIQGAAHRSPYVGERVGEVPGVVTAVGSNGFWFQSTEPDADPATSEGLLVFRGRGVSVGDSVTVTGTVAEYRSAPSNLSITEIVDPTVTVLASGGSLPASTLVGPGGRVPPSDVIEDDASGDVEQQTAFDPAQDGIDFWESLEGMRVGLENANVVGPSSRFGEVPVVPAGSGVMTNRGGIAIREGDLNPERVFVDDTLVNTPVTSTGDVLAGLVEGVLDYSFGNFKLLPTSTPTVTPGNLAREVTTPAADDELSVASYNVENLSPRDDQSKFDALAGQIVGNLAAPDLLTLEEVQDDSGPTNDGTVAADETLRLLAEAILRAGGPAYDWRQINPVDGAEGGQPGGNIRVAFLFRTDRGLKFIDRGEPSSTGATQVYTDKGEARLTHSPGRIAPESDAWTRSRVPLVGEFKWHGVTFFAVATHFSSKGGSDPLFGRWQPPTEPSAVQRHLQAQEVRDFADSLLAAQPDARLVVAGDINDFEFSETVDILVGDGATALTDLPRTLPVPERYTYVFEGNSQVLDHILLSPAWAARSRGYDIVHVNAEYADQVSDHDPQVVRLTKKVQH